MFGEKKTTISVWSNNNRLVDEYLAWDSDSVEFKKQSNLAHSKYLLIHIDLESDVSDITSKMYPLLASVEEKKIKVLACLSLSSNNQTSLLEKYLNILTSLYQKKINIRTLVIYDLYTLRSSINTTTTFDKFILDAASTKKIEISKNSKTSYYPLSLDQSIDFFKKLLFLNSTHSKNYYLAGVPIMDSDLAYLLNKNCTEICGTEIDINLSPVSKTTNIPYQKIYETQAELNIKVEDTLDNDLKHFMHEYKKNENPPAITSLKRNKITSLIHSLKRKLVFSRAFEEKKDYKNWALNKIEKLFLKTALIIVSVFCFSSLLFVTSSYYTLKSLESATFYLKKGDMSKTSRKYQNAKVSMNVVNANLQIVLPILSNISNDLGSKSLSIANFLSFTIKAFDGISQTYVLSERIYKSLNTPHNLDYNSTFLAIKSNLQQVYESLNQIEILLDGLDLPKPVYEAIKKNAEYDNLRKTKDDLWEFSKLIDIMPSLLGAEKNTNVFILVQNHNELRSTGGVVERIYHLSIDKGKTVFLNSYTPQEIEGYTDLSINPPPLVEQLTGDTNWKLRDMNYNPDFSQTATNIAWYLEDKLKTNADFVIGINLKVIESLLNNKELKGLNNSGITYEQYIADSQSGSSSAHTKELVDELINKILNHQIPMVNLFGLLVDNKKNYNFWSSDPSVQSQLFNSFVSQNINQKDCLPAISTSRKCIPQTIHINLSNFSNIPLNGYLERDLFIKSTPQVITIENEINLTTRYTKSTPLINRNLTEVVQLYLSKGSVLTSIKLNDREVSLSEVITQSEKDLVRYQFIISTPLNKEYLLSIKYSNQLPDRTVLPIAYSYNIIPQPGLGYSKQVLEINTPESSRVSAVTSKIDNYPGKIVVDLGDKDSFGYNLVGK